MNRNNPIGSGSLRDLKAWPIPLTHTAAEEAYKNYRGSKDLENVFIAGFLKGCEKAMEINEQWSKLNQKE